MHIIWVCWQPLFKAIKAQPPSTGIQGPTQGFKNQSTAKSYKTETP